MSDEFDGKIFCRNVNNGKYKRTHIQFLGYIQLMEVIQALVQVFQITYFCCTMITIYFCKLCEFFAKMTTLRYFFVFCMIQCPSLMQRVCSLYFLFLGWRGPSLKAILLSMTQLRTKHLENISKILLCLVTVLHFFFWPGACLIYACPNRYVLNKL